MKYAVVGVAMKVTMMTGMVCIGLGQGVQPLLGYCVGAKNWERYRSALKFSLIFAFILSTVLTLICYLFTGQIVSVFLTDAAASRKPFPYTQPYRNSIITQNRCRHIQGVSPKMLRVR